MKSIRDIGSTKNRLRNKVIMFSLALGLLVVVSTNAILPLELVKPAMAKTDKKLITTADIADNAVTSPKIKDGEVKTSDIADGTITGDDVSTGFMIRKTLHDDDAGHAQGWNPNNAQVLFFVKDNDLGKIDLANFDSTFISIMTQFDIDPVCSVVGTGTTGMDEPGFHVRCNTPPKENTELHYIIFKLPPHLIVSSASATPSSTSSSTPTISSPFSSLGDINPK